MFGGPSNEQYDALRKVVHALSELVQTQLERNASLEKLLGIVTDMAKRSQAECHFLKALSGSIIAELSAKSDDPYNELSAISRRVKYTANRFSPGSASDEYIQSACNLVCEYAEDYLRLGDK